MKVIKIRNKDGERVCDAAMDPGSGDIVLITKDGKHFKRITLTEIVRQLHYFRFL